MKSYLRFLSRNKLYTAIMAVGLTIALTFVIVFTCYVKQQLAVCYHYPDSDRIYLVGVNGQNHSYTNLETQLRDGIPELEKATRVEEMGNAFLYEGEKVFGNDKVLAVDNYFFDIFQTRFLYGSADDFKASNTVLVTESFARRYGMGDLIGKSLKSDPSKIKRDEEFIIVGIVEDFTESIFKNYEIIRHHQDMGGAIAYSSSISTFIKIPQHTDINIIKDKIPSVAKFWQEFTEDPILIRLDKLYWSDGKGDIGNPPYKREKRDRMIIFTIVVLFLLISAIINYVNLNVANAEKRAKEQAIRHVIGENRNESIIRIFFESSAFTVLAFCFAIACASPVTDMVNGMLMSPTSIKVAFSWDYIAIYCLLIIFISVTCSIAAVLTTLKHGVTSSSKTGRSLSGLFIGIQSVISFIMISAALTMEIQMKHMLEMDMNANMDDIYFTNTTDDSDFRQKLEELPFVKSIGRASDFPGNYKIIMELSAIDGKPAIASMRCDTAGFRILGYRQVEKYDFSSPFGNWLSESTANYYGVNSENPVLTTFFRIWDGPIAGIIKDSPVRNILSMSGNEHLIIEVVADSLAIQPFILEVEENKVHRQTLDSLVNAHHMERYGTTSTRHGFLRDLNKAEYDQTRRDIRMIELFMFIAIMLSCLAFLAMSMHYANRNQNAIVIHKVFGGSTGSEVIRNLKVYFKIMGVAVIVGLPVSIWICGRYLEKFAYRFRLDEKWWIFLVAVLISLTISTLTVLWQTIRAARTNPAEALKKE